MTGVNFASILEDRRSVLGFYKNLHGMDVDSCLSFIRQSVHLFMHTLDLYGP